MQISNTDTFVVVWINADSVQFHVETILAEMHMFHLILVNVWPAPDTCPQNMRKFFTFVHLV